jgi:hypothetical protein
MNKNTHPSNDGIAAAQVLQQLGSAVKHELIREYTYHMHEKI